MKLIDRVKDIFSHVHLQWFSAAPVFHQVSFQFRDDDGSESGATWRGSLNDHATDLSNDTNYRIRINWKEQNSAVGKNEVPVFAYSYKGGAYAAITTTSSYIKAVASGDAGFSDQGDTSQQLTSGGFDTTNACCTETGECGGTSCDPPQDGYLETELCFQIVSADVSNGDTIDIRCYDKLISAPLAQYDQTPRITVLVAQPEGAVVDGAKFQDSAVGSTGASVTVEPALQETEVELHSTLVRTAENITLTPDAVQGAGVTLYDPTVTGEKNASVTDGVKLTDTTTATIPFDGDVTISDGIKLQDTTDTEAGVVDSVSDTVKLSDSTEGQLALSDSVTDGVKLSDSAISAGSVTVAPALEETEVTLYGTLARTVENVTLIPDAVQGISATLYDPTVVTVDGGIDGAVVEGLKLSDTVAIGDSITIAPALQETEITLYGTVVGTDITLEPDSAQTISITLQTPTVVVASGDGASDAVKFSDSTEGQLALSDEITDSIKFADTTDVTGGLDDSVTDTIKLSDTTEGQLALSDEITEGVKLSDSTEGQLSLSDEITDSIKLTDTTDADTGVVDTVSDTIKLSDTTDAEAALSASVTDSIKLSELVSSELPGAIAGAVTDTAKLSDITSAALEIMGGVSDVSRFADSAEASLALSDEVTDSVKLSDSTTSDTGLDDTATDAVKLSDVTSATLALLGSVADTVKLSDITTGDIPGAIDGAVVEEIKFSDTPSTIMSLLASVSESARLQDNTSLNFIYLAAVADSVKFTDSGETQFTFSVESIEGLRLSESITNTLDMFVDAVDGVRFSDRGDFRPKATGEVTLTLSAKTATITFTAKKPSINYTAKKPSIAFS